MANTTVLACDIHKLVQETLHIQDCNVNPKWLTIKDFEKDI